MRAIPNHYDSTTESGGLWAQSLGRVSPVRRSDGSGVERLGKIRRATCTKACPYFRTQPIAAPVTQRSHDGYMLNERVKRRQRHCCALLLTFEKNTGRIVELEDMC